MRFEVKGFPGFHIPRYSEIEGSKLVKNKESGQWFIELNSLEELLSFADGVGDLFIPHPARLKRSTYIIEVIDGPY